MNLSKCLLSLLFIVIISNAAYSTDKFKKYEAAFEYIKHDTDYILEQFSTVIDSQNIQFCVQETLIPMLAWVFGTEIIMYEYNITDKDSVFKIRDTLQRLNDNIKKDSLYKRLNTLNKNAGACNLEVYFSEIEKDQLSAQVIVNLGETYINGEKAITTILSDISYYFYFNSKSKIKKVFKKNIQY